MILLHFTLPVSLWCLLYYVFFFCILGSMIRNGSYFGDILGMFWDEIETANQRCILCWTGCEKLKLQSGQMPLHSWTSICKRLAPQFPLQLVQLVLSGCGCQNDLRALLENTSSAKAKAAQHHCVAGWLRIFCIVWNQKMVHPQQPAKNRSNRINTIKFSSEKQP